MVIVYHKEKKEDKQEQGVKVEDGENKVRVINPEEDRTIEE